MRGFAADVFGELLVGIGVDVLRSERTDDGDHIVWCGWRGGPKLGTGIVARSFRMSAQRVHLSGVGPEVDRVMDEIRSWVWLVERGGTVVAVAGKRSKLRPSWRGRRAA